MSVEVVEAMSGHIKTISNVIYLWWGQFWVMTHQLQKAALGFTPVYKRAES